MTKLTLTVADRNTSGWQKTEAFLTARLTELREQNDSTSHDLNKTTEIRAQIALVKDMLRAAQDEAPRFKPVSLT